MMDSARVCGAPESYPLTGSLIIDFREFDHYWPEPAPVRLRLADVEMLPRGAHVRLNVGRVRFAEQYLDGLRLDHVSFTVESDSVDKVRAWVQGLRAVRV